MKNIGDQIAQSLLAYFANPVNLKELRKLQEAGLNFVLTTQAELISNALSEKTFVISGVFQNHSRDQLKELIKQHGGKVISSISAKLDYLVAGDKMGPAKRSKAEKLEIDIISEEEFEQLIAGTE